jgi:uncharacterized RDD family membrane protein YckC
VPGVVLSLLGFDAFHIGTQVTLGVVTLMYHAYLEGGPSGQTLGKRALGIRVMDFETGGPLGFARAAVRHLGRGVSGIVLGIGYLSMLWDRERRTWHDKLSDSVVVPVADYPL